MKKLFIITGLLMSKLNVLLLAVMCLSVVACCEESDKDTRKVYSATEGRFDVNENEFVRMYLSPASGFIDSPVELVIENHTESPLTFDAELSVEYFDGENWLPSPFIPTFVDIGFNLLAGETHKSPFDLLFWIEGFNNDKKGTYRIKKNITHPSIGTHTLFVEIEIKCPPHQ